MNPPKTDRDIDLHSLLFNNTIKTKNTIMKRINVKAYEKALVFRNGKLVDVLTSGKHWLGFGRKVQYYDVTELFYHENELNQLLQNEKFSNMVDITIVKDNEIMIQYKDGLFHNVLTPGKYCYWNDGIQYEYDRVDLNEIEVNDSIDRKVLHIPIVAKYFTVHIVESYEKGLLYIDGEMIKTMKPGLYYYWKGQKNAIIKKVDLRKQQMEISGQELLTKDKAAVRLNFYAGYQVTDVSKALDETKDYARQLHVLIQLGIREYVGQYSLDDLLANKQSASPYIMQYAKTTANSMGVNLLDCGIRDIILPGDVRDIMNQVLIAEKKAQANVIMRREETASTRSLLNTAKLMEDNEMLFRLKEMEYMEKISEKVGEISLNGGNKVMDQLRGLVGYKT